MAINSGNSALNDAKPSLAEQGYANREDKARHLSIMRQIPPQERKAGREDAKMEFNQGTGMKEKSEHKE